MPVLCVLATVWLWSLIPLAVKVAYGSFNPGFITFARLAGGTGVFAVLELAAGRGIRLPARRVPLDLRGPKWMGFRTWILIAGLGICSDLLLYTLGLRYTTASAATLIVSTDGIMLALLGVVVLRERMSWLKAMAGAAALAGLLLVGWNGQDMSALLQSKYLMGNLLVLSAACCWAVYALGQRVLAGMPGGTLLPVFSVGTTLSGLVALTQPVSHGPLRASALLALLYLGFGGTGLAYVLLVRGLARLEAATVGLLGSTLPLFTMVEARLLIGERITAFLLGGAALVIAGVTLMMGHQRIYGGDDPPASAA
jgi:drug/metabolite transporter (DMT)-like permease